jgi:hypothetical protein
LNAALSAETQLSSDVAWVEQAVTPRDSKHHSKAMSLAEQDPRQGLELLVVCERRHEDSVYGALRVTDNA